MKVKKNVWLLTVIAGAAGGVIPTYTNIAIKAMNPETFTIIRYVVTAVCLVVLALIMKEKISWRNVKKVLPISFLAAINAITFAVSMQYLSPASVQLIYPIVPILVVIFSWFILHQKTNIGKIVGVLVGFGGVAIVAVTPILTTNATLNFNLFGTFMVLAGATSFALYTVLSKPAQNYASPSDVLMGTVVATILCQVVFMLVSRTPLTLSSITIESVGAAVVVGVVGTTLFYWLYQYIIKVSSPLMASVIQYVMPFFGAFWAYVILGDSLPPIAMLGGLLAIAGAAQVNGTWNQLRKLLQKRQK